MVTRINGTATAAEKIMIISIKLSFRRSPITEILLDVLFSTMQKKVLRRTEFRSQCLNGSSQPLKLD
jgi:hypothetical protein